MREYGSEAFAAVSYLLTSRGHSSNATYQQDGDLIEWYTNEVRRHFLTFVRPVVTQVRSEHFYGRVANH